MAVRIGVCVEECMIILFCIIKLFCSLSVMI